MRSWMSETSAARESASMDGPAWNRRCQLAPAHGRVCNRRVVTAAHRRRARSTRSRGARSRARHFDPTPEAAAIGDRKARRDDVAGNGAGGANVDFLVRRDVARHGAHDDDGLARDLRLDVRLRTYGPRVIRHADAPFHAA